MQVEAIVGKSADLRLTQVSGAEAIAGETISGKKSRVLPDTKGVEPNRAHPDYAKVITELKNAGVGGADGALERSIVADAMFAAGSGAPTLVSVDTDVVFRLANHFGTPRLIIGQGESIVDALARKYPGGVSDIESP